jgi:hypothetical protein
VKRGTDIEMETKRQELADRASGWKLLGAIDVVDKQGVIMSNAGQFGVMVALIAGLAGYAGDSRGHGGGSPKIPVDISPKSVSLVQDSTYQFAVTQNERLTAYASLDAGNPNRVVMVAINKASTALDAGLKITHTKAFSTAEVWRVTGTNGGAGSCTAPVRRADIALPLTDAFNATVPTQSVTVFVLKIRLSKQAGGMKRIV